MTADSVRDLTTRLSQIEDRTHIADLVSAYNRTVDSRDLDGFVNLWSPQATYEVGDPPVVNAGPDQIRQALQRTLAAFESTHHLTGNLVVSFGTDGEASSVSDVVAHVVRADGVRDVIAATYHDDFVRENGSWLFSRRIVIGRSIKGPRPAPSASLEEIRTLCHRYTFALDQGDFRTVSELLSHSGLRHSMPGVIRQGISGAEAIERFYADQVIVYGDGDPRTSHLITNQVIELGDDGVTADSHCYFTVLQRPPQHDYQLVVGGRYHDRFEYVDGSWRFVDKTIHVDHLNRIELHFRIDDDLRR